MKPLTPTELSEVGKLTATNQKENKTKQVKIEIKTIQNGNHLISTLEV